MRKEDYALMHQLEEEYWWFVGMRKITHALISRCLARAPRSVLDIGCGTGINLLWMAQHFRPEQITGCDFSAIALSWCRETLRRSASYSVSVVPRLVQGDIRRLPFSSNQFDLVTSLDVMDLFPPTGGDVEGMSELNRILNPGGIAFVREPAYQWLFSSHDTLFETQHRYTCRELRKKMTLAGFEVLETTYANTILFPLAAAWRLLRRFGPGKDHTDTQPWSKSLEWVDGLFKGCMTLEAHLVARGVRLPFGLSAICIARKKP